ncbi:MAG: site-specific DNA-methyltransferase, partial [Fibromonadaceae bacterium]|nr:site-specific DNA-methyltransferase [Fibromonadaceae bacterium]
DTILDPFAGTGTTSITSLQTKRNSISIEIDPDNINCIKSRLADIRDADNIRKYYKDYICTDNLQEIWGNAGMIYEINMPKRKLSLFGEI